MKLIISFFILYNLSIFSQSDCGIFNTIFYKVEENHSEVSRNYFPNFVMIIVSSADSIKITLNDVDGNLVHNEYFSIKSSGKYVIKFYNAECPGVYFCTIKVGNEPDFKKAIQITNQNAPMNFNTTRDTN